MGFRKIALCVFGGILMGMSQSGFAVSPGSLADWERAEEHRGDALPPLSNEGDILLVPEEPAAEMVEVSEKAPKRPQSWTGMSHKSSGMTPVRSERGGKGIQDDTATTGENAKKKLPPYLVGGTIPSSSLLYDIHQIVTRPSLSATSP